MLSQRFKLLSALSRFPDCTFCSTNRTNERKLPRCNYDRDKSKIAIVSIQFAGRVGIVCLNQAIDNISHIRRVHSVPLLRTSFGLDYLRLSQ